MKIIEKILNLVTTYRLLILFITFLITFLLFYSTIAQGQQRYTIFRTQNGGFKFYKETNPMLFLDFNDNFFSIPGFFYQAEIGFHRRNNNQTRCFCDINESLIDCQRPFFISNYYLGQECYDWWRRAPSYDEVASRFYLSNNQPQFSINQGRVQILGDLRVENNVNNDCTWIPENGFYDLNQVSQQGETICPEGYFMKGIRFQGSSRDINSLDMWRIQCCKL